MKRYGQVTVRTTVRLPTPDIVLDRLQMGQEAHALEAAVEAVVQSAEDVAMERVHVLRCQ